ncbi:aspartate aminotransferase family protein [Pseudomonas sp. Bc-h]|jgi:aromatic-L-amino-acid decarboxylase|uniref:pyridoxal phosphate-dependent decarboxylase family protein n=1 Tax=Pseudomonas sp. Bc-h TaxID=1943632 RepID=UPI0009D9F2FD|nr:pyridoxal-dependent decarboxylase [Pseudomonas sp. Bc-h]OQR36697.1 aspartate aminotransferase family protein [Pseudomonas sp. Bc-h]
MNAEEFRKYGHTLIDWLADYRSGIAERPVQASTQPGEVRALLPQSPPGQPEPFDAVIADLDTVVLPHLTHWQHPAFFGYYPANNSLAGVLGELVSTGLGVLGLSWQSSPAVTEIEEVVVDWYRQMVGLSTSWVGVINDTASTSTLVSLISARERSTEYGLARGGLQGESRRLIVYASAGAHSSVEKGALLAGFGRENIRLVPLDDKQAMRTSELKRMIEADLASGYCPCAVVGCLGGTATASIDPIGEIADIVQEYGLWFHVDAAMAGAAMILPECRWMWEGIEGADSVVINAHKWLGAPFDCSLYYVRDEQHLLRVMSTNPSYLQSSVDGQVRNLRDTGIPLGRRFRALKMWFLIREEGVCGLQSRLRRDISNAKSLQEKVAAMPGWKVLAPVQLQTVCVRYEPQEVNPEALDQYTRAWVDDLNRSGEGFLTPATIDGRWMVRISIGALETEADHVDAIWEAMQRHAQAQLKRYVS